MAFFTTKDHAEAGFGIVKPGEYMLSIERVEIKETRNGTGRYVNCMFDILGPAFAGRKIFKMFNIENQNEIAQQIGCSEFASMLRAIGRDSLESEDDLQRLVSQVVKAEVVKRFDKFRNEDSNDIKKFIGKDTAPAAKEKETPRPAGRPSEDIPF